MEKLQLRAVGKPRNVYNSLSKPLVLPSSHPTSDSAAVCQQERYYTSTRLIACGSISYSKSAMPTRVRRAFPSQLTVRPSSEIPLPTLTSTPIASKTASNHHNNTSKT